MKKITIFNWFVTLLFFSITFISCGDNDSEKDEPNEELGWNSAILGTWQCIIEEEIEGMNMTFNSIELEFTSNSIELEFTSETEMTAWFNYSGVDQGGGIWLSLPQKYTYKIQGERIRFVNLRTNEVSDVICDITGDNLYISLKSGAKFPYLDENLAGSSSAIYTKVKE